MVHPQVVPVSVRTCGRFWVHHLVASTPSEKLAGPAQKRVCPDCIRRLPEHLLDLNQALLTGGLEELLCGSIFIYNTPEVFMDIEIFLGQMSRVLRRNTL